MKILVVEDEEPLVAFLRKGLGEEGFAVDAVRDAEAADRTMRINEYDLVLLDVMLPGGNGFDLCRKWRREGVTTPILFLTARDEVRDRVQGLDRGGDDYLVKPFAFAELLARIRALLRRGGTPPAAAELHLGNLVIDTNRHRVTRAGTELPLTMREYQLLEHLARNAGRVVSRSELWEHIWASDTVPDSNVVDVYIGYLRNKLGRQPDLIRTVRGGGYMIERPDAEG